jgi:hypothetical protein
VILETAILGHKKGGRNAGGWAGPKSRKSPISTFKIQILPAFQFRERKSNNLRNLMRIGKRRVPSAVDDVPAPGAAPAGGSGAVYYFSPSFPNDQPVQVGEKWGVIIVGFKKGIIFHSGVPTPVSLVVKKATNRWPTSVNQLRQLRPVSGVHCQINPVKFVNSSILKSQRRLATAAAGKRKGFARLTIR